MSKKNKKAYVVPHTHWDREWRYPLWKNRELLINFFKQLLTTLDTDPNYACFLLDGQCAPVDDYLEVMPEDREKLVGYIEQGRIAVGPWYTLPDLYPVDAECLVRNLCFGIRRAKEYGRCLNVAYMTFGWGQTAQLPQIYDQCGFDFIICAKKVSEERAPQAEFLWESPDGTKVLTSRLGTFARANLLFHTYIPYRYGIEFLEDGYHYDPAVSGMAYHPADKQRANQDHFLIEPKKQLHPETLKENLQTALKATDNTVLQDHRLLLNGCDFSTPQPELSTFLKHANAVSDEYELIHTSLEEYAQILHENIDKNKLRIVKGELRDGPSHACSGNALATRMYLKTLNKKVQNQLIKRAEPFVSLMGLVGRPYKDTMLDIAWKYMFQCHAHDSINGVTQDKTADDVENRLQQALEISEVVFDRAAGDITRMIDLSAFDSTDILIVIFNALPRQVTDVINVSVDLPQKENIWNFDIIDCDGNNVRLQERSRQEHVAAVHDLDGRPWPYSIDRHNVYIETRDIPAYGYKVYCVRPKERFKRNYFYDIAMRESEGADIGASNTTLENKFLHVTANADGTIDLFDKEHNRNYPGLHAFEDSGDVGNYWAYYPPYKNKVVSSKGAPCTLSMTDNGPLCATLTIETTLNIPESGNRPDYGIRGKSERNNKTVPLNISSEFTLKKGGKKLEVHTRVLNTAENHRLRVLLPTGINTDTASASGHFTVDTRPSIATKNKRGKYYPEMNTLPLQHFVDVSDGKNGLAVLTSSFTEYEFGSDPQKTLFLTMFRAMNNEIVTGWRVVNKYPEQKGSQVLRNLEFDYALYPHTGTWDQSNTCFEAEQVNVPLYPVQVSGQPEHTFADDVIKAAADTPERTLPLKHSFFEIAADNLILSAFKKAFDRDSWIVRLFNPTAHEINGFLHFFTPLKQAYYASINEERKAEIPLGKERTIVPVSAAPNKIVTVEVTALIS